MLIGSLMTPLVPGTGAVDPAATIDRLMRAWERGDSSALCAELHPRLRLTDALFGSKCEVAEGRATVTRVTSPAFEGWSADGTMIVALRIEQGDAAATVHHVVTPVAGGSVVTGLFFDLDDALPPQAARLAPLLKRLAERGLKGVVLAGRPYHVDPEVNHGVPSLINKLGMRDSLYLYSLSDALSDENWSEAGVLASVLNWTAYIQNTNLIGFGDGKQLFDLTSYTRHIGRDTTGDLLSKGVFTDRARGFIKGLIDIQRSAIGTDSLLGEFGLLFTLPLYLQNVLGLSALGSGAVLAVPMVRSAVVVHTTGSSRSFSSSPGTNEAYDAVNVGLASP